MRNYIILNGQNSQNIRGLLIQSLAPITKPQMRTQTEEIDGRDGDIVEDLGFASYDKQITVGLYGDYDVDEVIAYFNSKGTVVFSNEPDKYYYYQIYDQIDFERLVRFRTATVTMHCQPFKYSTTEGAEILSPSDNLLSIPSWSRTTNGITMSVQNGVITVTGKGTATTEFYLPITPLTLQAGTYTWDSVSDTVSDGAVSLRLIGSAPSDADSFGNTFTTLIGDKASMTATLTASKTYNYIWFFIAGGVTLNFTMTSSVEDEVDLASYSEGDSDGTITNNGNIYSKPRLTVYGSGDIGIYLDNVQIFEIALGDEGHITIDTNAMEAYKDTLSNLKNRLVTGDYNNFKLAVGENEITFSGTVTKCIVEKYSRWL